MFALNQGEVCTCPSRALIQESIYEKFMERALAERRGHYSWKSARSNSDDGCTSFKGTNGKNLILPGHR